MSEPLEARRRANRSLAWIATHCVAIAIAVAFIAPIVFLLLTSLMSDQQALSRRLWPDSWQWSNYLGVLKRGDFLTWWKNTVLYAVLATVFMLLSSVPVAYALTTFRFRGRRLMMLLVVAAMMLPPQVTVIPMYLVWAKQFHLNGTIWPLVLPLLFGDAFSIFLLRQFLLTIPRDYIEAARIDGASELRTLLRVVLPMARPAIAAVALFQFFYAWNDYFGPQIYSSDNPAAWTLSYGLDTFNSAHQVNWNLTMAATMLVTAPVLVVFFFAQRAFIEGVTLTGVKA